MLFEKFCEVMQKLQHGTFQEFEQSRSEMSALCVEADEKLSGLTPDAADRYYRCLGCGANLKGNQVEHEVFHKVVSKDEEGVESVSSCGPVIEQK